MRQYKNSKKKMGHVNVVNNPFVVRKKKLKHTFNKMQILTYEIIISIHSIFKMCP